MNTTRSSPVHRLSAVAAAFLVTCVFGPLSAYGQAKKKNPTSKLYISDVGGEAQIDIGDSIQDLTKKSVYNAEGTIIETRKADKEEDKNKIFSTMVYSNGTGAYFDQNTRVEMKKFVQEPFTPNRVDMDTEPSISQTQAFVARGAVGLCNSKQVAGSTMNYATAQGSVAIRGKKVVIQANDGETTISMLEGDSTVRAGALDMGGQTLKTGQQAIIRPGRSGGPNQVVIQNIPASELAALDDKVAQACMAKKTVYFEVREKQSLGGDSATGDATAGETTTNSGDGTTVTAFDGNTATNTSSVSVGEIVVIPTVPTQLPVQFTVSPATLLSAGGPGGE
jgi:hypothetical protein